MALKIKLIIDSVERQANLLETEWLIERNAHGKLDHATFVIDDPTNTISLSRGKEVLIEAFSFYMAMDVTAVDQWEIETIDATTTRLVMRGGLDCTTAVGQADSKLGDRNAEAFASFDGQTGVKLERGDAVIVDTASRPLRTIRAAARPYFIGW